MLGDARATNAVFVNLKDDEFWAAWNVGRSRHEHHCARKNRVPAERGRAEEGCGAVAEYASTKLFGGTWNDQIGEAHYGSHDLVTACGDVIELKATEWVTGRLLVYPKTDGDLVHLLAVVMRDARAVKFCGWMRAREAHCDEWWQRTFHTPCWAVPQQFLHPVLELPCLQQPYSPPSSPGVPPTSGATATPPKPD